MTAVRELLLRHPTRVYLYGVTVAVVAIFVSYGVVADVEAVVWLGLAQAILIPGAAESVVARVTPVARPALDDGSPATLLPYYDPDGVDPDGVPTYDLPNTGFIVPNAALAGHDDEPEPSA